jgi:hypothetical protein
VIIFKVEKVLLLLQNANRKARFVYTAAFLAKTLAKRAKENFENT